MSGRSADPGSLADPDAPWWWAQVGVGPVLYLAPHSDDAAFSSAGLLHACVTRRIGVRIVTCFSRSGHARGVIDAEPDVVTRMRQDEDRRFVAALSGDVTVRWLGLEDAPLRPAHRGQHPCKEATMTPADEALGERIARALAPELKNAAWLLAPLGLGRHIDHRIVRDVAATLARCGRVPVAWWEDLPYAGRVDTATLREEIDATRDALGLPLRPVLLRDARLADTKRAALSFYPSQVIDIHRRGVLGHLRRVAGDGTAAERLWVTAEPFRSAGPK